MRHLRILLALALLMGATLPFWGPRVVLIAGETHLPGGLGASAGPLEFPRQGRLEASLPGEERSELELGVPGAVTGELWGYAARPECTIEVRP